MALAFSIDEVLEMAEQIERNGADFYRRAAAITTLGNVRKLLEDLAAWEEGHEQTFAQMQEQLSKRQEEPVLLDPDNEAALYLRAMADEHIFGPKTDPAQALAGVETPAEILKRALKFEEDSIAFYEAMKEQVGLELGKDEVVRIIDEEQSHVVMLNEQIASLR